MSKIELKDNVAKKALYEFKKFARANGFWEKYKMMSQSIQKGYFIDKLNDEEPIKLIQNIPIFCYWPPSEVNYWRQLSKQWGKFCIDNKLYRNEKTAKYYFKVFINTEK